MREATSKSPGQREKILAWLRMRGPQGVLNTELTELCMRFGARIYELRKAGHDIKTVRVSETEFKFVLTEQPETDLTRNMIRDAVKMGQEALGRGVESIAGRTPQAHEYRKQASLFA